MDCTAIGTRTPLMFTRRPSSGMSPVTALPNVTSCAAGRFFHHRPDDDLSRIDVNVMAASLDAVADLMSDLASAETLPFPTEIPMDERAAVAFCWDDLFGGWNQ